MAWVLLLIGRKHQNLLVVGIGAIAIGHFLKSFQKIHQKLKHHHRVNIVVTKIAMARLE